MKIAHLTSVHPRFDVRIYYKMCNSLAKMDYDVYMVVADGKGDELKDIVKILDVGLPKHGRLSRLTRTVKLVYEKAKELDADIYHLHDPELIHIGLKLKKLGKKIVYDAHEDLPNQIYNKDYLPHLLKKILIPLVRTYQNWSVKQFDAIITSTSYIEEILSKFNCNTYCINNFPIIDELKNKNHAQNKKREICYIGVISKERGIYEINRCLDFVPNVRLNLAGNFVSQKLRSEVKNLPQWSKVNELGYLNRKQVKETMERSVVGLLILHSNSAYLNSLPIKLFEYMIAGLPVVCSNFAPWREIVEKNNIGLCVDPNDPQAIGKAIKYIMDNPREAQQMSENGIRYVEDHFNWTNEEKKLMNIYDCI